MDLNMKFISKFNHRFTNRGFHCAILKALYSFKEKKISQGKRNTNFPSKCSKCDFQDFQNV